MKLYTFANLSRAEEKLLNHVTSGSYQLLNVKPPFSLEGIHNSCTIRSSFLRAIITRKIEDVSDENERIHLIGAVIKEELNFTAETIDREIIFEDCVFEKKIIMHRATSKAIIVVNSEFMEGFSGDGMKVDGEFYLINTVSRKSLSLKGSKVSGVLDFRDSEFKDRNISFSADRLETTGSIFFENVKSKGDVVFTGSKIGGDLNASQSKLAIFAADKVEVAGDIFMDKIEATGGVRFIGAIIGGNLSFHGSKLKSERSLLCNRIKIGGAWLWRCGAESEGLIDLSGAEIGIISDQASCWPQEINLDRCTYKGFQGNSTPTDASSRIDWLSRMNPNKYDHDFWPQPYEECARVLQGAGDNEGAKRILIVKERILSKTTIKKSLEANRHSESMKSKIFAILVTLPLIIKHLSRGIIGYGHRPLQALYGIAGLTILGAFVFEFVYLEDGMRPNQPEVLFSEEWVSCNIANQTVFYRREIVSQIDCYLNKPGGRSYPKFNSISYSFGVLVPVMPSEGQSNWIPNDKTFFGRYALRYLWIHAILGWLLMLLAVAGFSGIVKTDSSR